MAARTRHEDGAPATLAYGRLAIGVLALVTIGSASALTVALAIIVAAPGRLPGLPYGDIAAAVVAVGAAASLASLSSASAYFAQVAGDRASKGASATLRTTTFALMTGAYLAFAAGGMAFTHFSVSAVRALSQHTAPR